VVEWVDGNFGSKLHEISLVILKGEGSRADILSMAMAGAGQNWTR
jgi:Fe-S cluster assembly protein SufB